MASIGLPYNVILGYLALAKFMSLTHHAYNTIKLPGCSGTITIRCVEKDALQSLEEAYKATPAAHPVDEDVVGPVGTGVPRAAPKTQRIRASQVFSSGGPLFLSLNSTR